MTNPEEVAKMDVDIPTTPEAVLRDYPKQN